MPYFTRLITSGARFRVLNSACFRQQPRKDRLANFGLTRFAYSTGTTGNYGDDRTQIPKSRNFAMIAAVIGGLSAYAYQITTDDHKANCAGKDGGCEVNCKDSSCIHKMDKEERMIAKANKELENALKDVKPKAMEMTEAALKAYCEAVIIMKAFMDTAYCAIEQEGIESPKFEETWCEVFELAVKRCQKVKDALHKGKCAWELLCRLKEIIENGKTCKYTSCNPLLITAEEFLNCAERELLNARAKMDCVQSDSVLVEQYRDLIVSFRKDMKAEMDKMKDQNPELCELDEDECKKVFTQAYKKVLLVQKELALIQVGMGKVPCKQSQPSC